MSDYPLPDAALDGDIAILGRKGGGKTYTAKGIVERLLDLKRRVLILDPLGVWTGLRTAAMARVDLAELLGWVAISGHLKNVLGSMRTLEIIDCPSQGTVAVAAWVRE